MGGRDLMAGVATMTSREISDICEARHNDVVATIERLIDQGVLRLSRNTRRQQAPEGGGRPTMIYDLTKRDCLVVVSGYNAELRAKIIDRWMELEEAEAVPALALPDFTNPALAARAWAEQFEAKLALTAQIVADAPKVAFAEAIRSIDGVCHIEKVAKTLGFGRNKFFKRLRDDGILMRSNLPYQKYIDREYFTVNEQEPYTDKEGVKHPTFTAMVTGAGQVFLARKYSPPAL